MKDLRAATDDEVILAWLQAEIASSRFRAYFLGPSPSDEQMRMVNRLVFNPNLRDARENAIRRRALTAVRGFGVGTYIFRGLGTDIVWRKMRFAIEEVGQMLYANNVATWSTLAPTLRVSEGAERVHLMQPPDDYVQIIAIAKSIHDARRPPEFPEIICLRRPDGGVSLMEGHSRATAFVMEGERYPNGIVAYVGSGPSVANWFYL